MEAARRHQQQPESPSKSSTTSSSNGTSNSNDTAAEQRPAAAARRPLTIKDSKPGPGSAPPRFTVDLSLPPQQRYVHIVPHLQAEIAASNLTGLFDELVRALVAGSPLLGGALHLLARVALRRVYSAEETAELRGISVATHVPMHLLVAFNVLLDLLLGCTSGGVRVEEEWAGPGSASPASRILHFRTLDWGMEPLRRVVVELDFVRRPGGPVVATSITYFGFVGVLTGVRRGLSTSLNFRPRHDCSTRAKRVGFRLQQALVVLGWRQSVSSVMRRYLLCPEEELLGKTATGGGQSGWFTVKKMKRRRKAGEGNTEDDEELGDKAMRAILDELSTSPSTSCYLIFCTPQHVYSVEKDHHVASVRDSDTFLTTYNHDAADEIDTSQLAEAAKNLGGQQANTGMEGLVEYSCDRKRHLDKVLRKRLERRRRKTGRPTAAIGTDDLLVMVKDPWISNEESHYAVVMDPTSGQILWRSLYDLEAETI